MTVIIPTRNRKAFLKQAVHDALRQEGVELEIVVVDDGSTLEDAVQDIEGLDGRIRVVHHDIRRGVSCARNTGIRNARGIWLAFFDDDDRWSPAKLRTQLDVASNLDAQWVYSGSLSIDAKDRVLLASAPPDEALVMRHIREYNAIPGGCSNVIARADVVRELGGFDERLALIADWDLWIRLAGKARPAACQGLLVGYRVHRDNMHVRDVHTIDSELSHVARKYNATSPEHPVQPDPSIFLAYHGNAQRRGGHRSAAARLYLQRWKLTHDVSDLGRAISGLLGESISGIVRRSRPCAKVARPSWLEGRGPSVDPDARKRRHCPVVVIRRP